MKLSISNIAWTDAEDEEIFQLLSDHGVSAIEVAPTRLWPDWSGADITNAVAYRQTLAENGLVCSSLQSVLYNQPNLKLFGTQAEVEALAEHLRHVADLAHSLGAGPIVFGAPKNRDRGHLDEKSVFAKAVDFFSEVSAYCASKDVCLCIEPNPEEYGCNFITDGRSGADLVRAVNSPGFALHLDAAGMYLSGDDPERTIEAAADVLAHFHVSEPNLGDFSQPQVEHRRIAKALKAIGWKKWVAIEMRATERPLVSVKEALSRVAEVYELG